MASRKDDRYAILRSVCRKMASTVYLRHGPPRFTLPFQGAKRARFRLPTRLGQEILGSPVGTPPISGLLALFETKCPSTSLFRDEPESALMLGRTNTFLGLGPTALHSAPAPSGSKASLNLRGLGWRRRGLRDGPTGGRCVAHSLQHPERDQSDFECHLGQGSPRAGASAPDGLLRELKGNRKGRRGPRRPPNSIGPSTKAATRKIRALVTLKSAYDGLRVKVAASFVEAIKLNMRTRFRAAQFADTLLGIEEDL